MLESLIGGRYGRLVAVSLHQKGRAGHRPKYLCTCDCGQEKIIDGGNLLKGLTKSCGCIKCPPERRIAKKNGDIKYLDNIPCRKGHISEKYTRNGFCVLCSSLKEKAERHKYKDRQSQYLKNKKANDPEGCILYRVRHRSKQKGWPCELKRQDIIIPERCPCCNRKLAGVGAQKIFNHASPSVDRFDSNLPYAKNNIVIICWRCNHVKTDASINELRTIANWMERHNVT